MKQMNNVQWYPQIKLAKIVVLKNENIRHICELLIILMNACITLEVHKNVSSIYCDCFLYAVNYKRKHWYLFDWTQPQLFHVTYIFESLQISGYELLRIFFGLTYLCPKKIKKVSSISVHVSRGNSC